MAVSRFANAKPLAGTNTLLWEADRQALVSVVAVNIGGTTKISAYVDPSDEPPAANIYYIDEVSLKNRDTFETFKLAINVGDSIYVSSESGDVSFFTNGIYDKNGTVDIHVGDQAPISPVSIGTIWINETDPNNVRVQFYSGTEEGFLDAGTKGTFEVFDAPPEDPDEGNVWFNSSDGRFYVYYDNFWVEALSNEAGPTGPTGPSGGPPGPTGPTGAGIIWRGNWVTGPGNPAEITYAINDAVSWNNRSYIAVAPSNGFDVPPDSNGADWDLLADRGATGPSGVISVTNPITNTGTSTNANIGINLTSIIGSPAEPDTNASTAKNLGYIGLPQVILNTGNLTLSRAHAGEHIYVTGASQTITIPSNASVPLEIGTTVVIINANVASTIAITTDTLRLAGTTSTGTRTLAANGMATLVKITSTSWIVSGNGLS
jgi:hypothetical protein